MSRPIKTIKLSEQEVDIITYLNWGEKEELQNILLSGAKLNNLKPNSNKEDVDVGFDSSIVLKTKYALLEMAIIEIRKGNEKVEYSKEWMNNLTQEDGDKLYNAVEDLNKKKG